MSPTFRSLHNPNYRLYAAGGVVSNTGTWMQRVAQDWLVLQLTANSGAALGITTGLQFLPFLLIAPFAGLVADRMPKQRLLQLTNLGMALPAAGVSSRNGRNWRPVVMPSAVAPEPTASWRTSQSWATRCIQVPVLDTTPPVA